MPFCPRCKTEYISGTELCETCKVRVVDSLAEKSADEDPGSNDLAELAKFSNVSEAEMIREILEKNGIQTVQRGEADPIGIASGAEPIALLVEERHLSQAQELYRAYFAGAATVETPTDQP